MTNKLIEEYMKNEFSIDEMDELKKINLEKLFEKYPGNEKLNLKSSSREEPENGFPILEVSERTEKGDKKWLPFKIGLLKYGNNITLRRILPDELSIDCDDISAEVVKKELDRCGFGYTHWSTNTRDPNKNSHIRAWWPQIRNYKPYERQALKWAFMSQIKDEEGNVPDPCTAQPCKMISVEWGRHHKRPEYLRRVDEVNPFNKIEMPEEWIKEVLENNKKLIKTKRDFVKGDTIQVDWECPYVETIMETGLKKSGRHRGALVIGAYLNNRGIPLKEAEEIALEWNKKNEPQSKEDTLLNQINMAYNNGITHISCEWLKNQKLCEQTNCEAEKKNKERYKKKVDPLTEPEEEFKHAVMVMTDKLEQARQFIKKQPMFYDKSKLYWLWDHKEFRWVIVDETDLLNKIKAVSIGAANTIQAKDRTEIIEALRQVGRQNMPEPTKNTWVQFKDKIVDIETGKSFKADPKYHNVNPIPWKLGESAETPTMDRIFAEWVGEEKVETLYEIIAYCMLPDYPLHRIFCFVGAGMNGKSKYMDLITKFVGLNNSVNTDLDTLLSSRFESSKLYKKLACMMGETDYDTMKKTSKLKRLTGQDLVGYEFKNKDPFDDYNYAKILISTNGLPQTEDKSVGFYRRWMIIDFPFTFTEKKDILAEIPEIEYENLAKRSIQTLITLMQRREFTSEGTLEDRKKKYEETSDPLQKYLDKFIEKDSHKNLPKWKFKEAFVGWMLKNGYREWSDTEIGVTMKSKGFVDRRLTVDTGKFQWCWVGISLKIIKGINTIKGVTTQNIHRKLSGEPLDSLDSIDSKNMKPIAIDEMLEKWKKSTNSKKTLNYQYLHKNYGFTLLTLDKLKDQGIILEEQPRRFRIV